MSGLLVHLQGIGLYGPGLPSWAAAQDVLAGRGGHVFARTVLQPPRRLPPAESRRAGSVVRLAMQVADEAIEQAGLEPRTLATVFASSGGEGTICHALCESLASANPLVSPIKFTNSVHNAAAGNWHIAVGSRAASTSLSAFDGSFAAGLLEAATTMRVSREPLLLVAYDVPYPEPLHRQRTLLENFGVALALTPVPTPRTLASLSIALVDSEDAPAPDTCSDVSLERLRSGIPAATALPLLQALARLDAVASPAPVLLDYLPRLHLRVEVAGTGGAA